MSEELTLKDFLKKYSTTYDPKRDTYDIGPFQKSFDDASKSSKIYNMHMYWTKQDPFVVKQFIEYYTKPGDIVLDAFAGTGMTGVAAMLSGRNTILTEISPACIHIAKNYTTPIEPRILDKVYRELLAKAEPEIRPLYKTECHNCKNKDAQIANTILSDVFLCPRCRNEVLFVGDDRWERMKKGEKITTIKCNKCKNEFTKAKAVFLRVESIEIRVNCPRCKIRGDAKAKPLDKKDWELYKKIESMDVPYWYPKDVKFFGQEPRRNEKRGITHPYQMFSRRNLIALSILWYYVNAVKEENAKEKLRFAFTGVLFAASFMLQWRQGPAGVSGSTDIRKGTLYIPSIIKDMNVLEIFKNRCEFLTKYAIRPTQTTKHCISLFSALRLNELPENSVDYLYYDPPYGSNINYSELNIMWEAWLRTQTDNKDEIIENKHQRKGRKEYEEMMLKVLEGSFKILKPNRWLSIVYSYADPSMYNVIQNIAHKTGFIDEGEVLHVSADRRSFMQISSDKAQQRYLVINFKKPKNGERKVIDESEDIEYSVIKVIQDFLVKHPGKTRDYIYDQVIKQLFTTVQIQKFDLDMILNSFFRKVGNEWYAPGTLIKREGPVKQDLFKEPEPENPEKEVILKMQDFLHKYKIIPYSELREFYLRKVNIKLESKRFDELIEENFIVEKGRVRIPTAEELEKKKNMSTSIKIRQVNKLLEGTLDTHLSDEDLCDLVEFCYENAQGDKDVLYRKAYRISGAINKDNVKEGRYKNIKKISEICRIKSE